MVQSTANVTDSPQGTTLDIMDESAEDELGLPLITKPRRNRLLEFFAQFYRRGLRKLPNVSHVMSQCRAVKCHKMFLLQK